VLEFGVGTGRVALPLLEDGLAVTGIDRDPQMLARAREAARALGRDDAGRLELIEADFLEMALDTRFGLVVLALNSLMLLGDADRQAATIARMAAHLRPDGLAVVDVWLPGPEDLVAYDGRQTLEWVRDDPETGERVSKTSSARFDPATDSVELVTVFDAWPATGGAVRRTDRVDQLRLVRPDALVRMAEDAGLAVESVAGGYDLAPFGPGAERVVLVGRV
jgi:SAM-dependent methyltransferase